MIPDLRHDASRWGAARGLTYSVADKLAVARLLDEFGVGFIEGGWPGAVPKDTEFFRRARTELELKHAVLVAFGSTRKAGVEADARPADPGRCSTPRPRRSAWSRSPTSATSSARCAPRGEENLAMVRDSVDLPDSAGPHGSSSTASTSSTASASTRRTPRSVVRDRARRRRRAGGACATPTAACCRRMVTAWPIGELAGVGTRPLLGMHCQNDTACAVANTIAAVEAGVRHVPGHRQRLRRAARQRRHLRAWSPTFNSSSA